MTVRRSRFSRSFFGQTMESGGALVAIDLRDGRVIGSTRFNGYDETQGERSFASFTGAVNRHHSHIVYIDVLNEVSVMPPEERNHANRDPPLLLRDGRNHRHPACRDRAGESQCRREVNPDTAGRGLLHEGLAAGDVSGGVRARGGQTPTICGA